jgi:hypothetical protein
MERRMMPLAWKAELRAARKFAFSARLGKLITYHVLSRSDVYPAYVEVRGLRGSLKRVDLGCYNSVRRAGRSTLTGQWTNFPAQRGDQRCGARWTFFG